VTVNSDAKINLDNIPAGALDFNIRYAPRAEVIYYNMPKAGCSSILWTLTRYELDDAAIMPERVGSIHRREDSPILRGGDVDDLVSLLERDDVLRFTIVRNPFDRILSCYTNKIIRATPQRSRVLDELRLSEEAGVSLLAFLALVANQAPEQRDPHWATQDDLLFRGALPIDIIGRFENFDADLAEIGKRIDPDFARFIYTERRHGTGVKDYSLVGSAEAELIREIYRADFTRLGYSRELPGETP